MQWLKRQLLKPLAKGLLKMVLGDLAEIAVYAVRELASYETLTDQEKRRRAYESVKTEGLKRGRALRDSAINLAVELAVQLIK